MIETAQKISREQLSSRIKKIWKWSDFHNKRLTLFFTCFSLVLGINGPKDLLIEYESLLIKLQLYMEDNFRGFLNLDNETRSLPGILICDRGMSYSATSLYIFNHSEWPLSNCLCMCSCLFPYLHFQQHLFSTLISVNIDNCRFPISISLSINSASPDSAAYIPDDIWESLLFKLDRSHEELMSRYFELKHTIHIFFLRPWSSSLCIISSLFISSHLSIFMLSFISFSIHFIYPIILIYYRHLTYNLTHRQESCCNF